MSSGGSVKLLKAFGMESKEKVVISTSLQPFSSFALSIVYTLRRQGWQKF